MTTPSDLPFSRDDLERMNSKAVENQFFTPDHVYIELALLKDIQLGVVYADLIAKGDTVLFEQTQQKILSVIEAYQKRNYDTVNEFLGLLGYDDDVIEYLLHGDMSHDNVFIASPTSHFFNTLIAHTIRNQNHSGPANKFTKKKLDNRQYTLDAIPVTFYINTYPLNLSDRLMKQLAPELGEAFGVNIQFVNKNPSLFDQQDWDNWLSKIECFYLHSLGRFTRGDFILQKQADLALCGCYIFARKRFETDFMAGMAKHDFEEQIPWIEACIGVMCDFAWLENNDVRLTEDAETVASDTDAANPDEEQTT